MPDKFNILDYTDGPLLKTGQTTNYTPAGRTCKDDGGQQIGIAGSLLVAQYEILTLGQYSGTVNITVNGKTDTHSNNTVFDKVTGLQWMRAESAAVFGTGAQDLFWADTVTNEDIFAYCDAANIALLAGFSDWRVPNITELHSLCKLEAPSGSANSTAFPTLASIAVYSSTTQPNVITNAIVKNFASGFEANGAKTTVRNKCLLVRNP